MSPIVERLTHPSTDDLPAIQEIYEVNFPPSGRKLFSHFPPRIASGEYICMLARSEATGGGILGFALLMVLPISRLALLEYLAVAPPFQGQGVGSTLLRSTAEYVHANEVARGLVWEVEPPGEDALSDNNRRIRFYERLGGRLIRESGTYAMPNFQVGRGGIPLRLMQLPLEKEPSITEVAEMIREIYQVAYPEWSSLCDKVLAELGLESNVKGA
jgi:GNAT superfamily N-acetyltransferase